MCTKKPTRMEMGKKDRARSLPLCLAEELLQVRSTCVLCLPTRAAVTHCKYSKTAAESPLYYTQYSLHR